RYGNGGRTAFAVTFVAGHRGGKWEGASPGRGAATWLGPRPRGGGVDIEKNGGRLCVFLPPFLVGFAFFVLVGVGWALAPVFRTET
ncbi:hypothetical protein DNR41_27445, partial [Escherichia coli]